MKTSHIRNT